MMYKFASMHSTRRPQDRVWGYICISSDGYCECLLLLLLLQLLLGGRRRADEIPSNKRIRRNDGAAAHYYILCSVEVGPASDFVAGVGFDVFGFRRAGAGCGGGMEGGADCGRGGGCGGGWVGHCCEVVLVESVRRKGSVERWRGGGGGDRNGDGGEKVQVQCSWRGTLEERLKGAGG